MLLIILLEASLLAVSACSPGMLKVPSGPFIMGSDAAERAAAYAASSTATRDARWFDAELPRHEVSLPAFCIDRSLVTQREYATFVTATGHRVPGISEQDYQAQGFLAHDYDREVRPYLWRDGRPPSGREGHPVVLVDTTDAEAYCHWRGPTLALPTESQWEKAARGGDGRRFPWGDAWDATALNSAERGPGGTTAVTRHPKGASVYGMLDAAGNVFQWTLSSLADGHRVLKGCAWDDEQSLCRPAFRHARSAASRHILIGFRCVGPAAGGQRSW
jgi:formylglycine-generating enzyme required for sulfatase activity